MKITMISSRLRKNGAAYLSLMALIIALMLPNLAWLWFAWHVGSIPVGELGLAVCLAVIWFALFGKALWLGCLLLAPVMLVMPLELYYIVHFHQPSSVSVLGTLFATNSAETQEYVGKALIPIIIGCCASLIVTLLAAWFTTRQSALRWEGRLRYWIAYASIGFVLALPPLFGRLGGTAPVTSRTVIERAIAGSKYELHQLALWAAPGYPFGVAVRVGQFVVYRHEMLQDAARLSTFRFGAHFMTPLPSRQVYVLVIGESSQRSHWQLFGYGRPTNPKLSQEPNLVPIQHLVSAYTQTMLALPVMLTRKPASWPGSWTWPEASIVRAMDEAGFSTWWISNQYAIGPYDSAVAIYANEADHLIWLNHGGLSEHQSLDGDLIAPLRNALESTHANLFVVLHMIGSHNYYDYRYPSDFSHFHPTESNHDSDVPAWQRITNSYDNTIVYTDYVLTQIIDVLKASGAVSAMWYASDHGETLPSPACHERYHGHENRPEYQIPALFWYSNSYANAFPNRVANVRANADKLTMSENIFPSLVDMAGLDFPGHAKRETWSLFSSNWHFHTRWVNQFHLVDFDHAKVSSGCMTLTATRSPSNAHVLSQQLPH